MTAVAVPVDRAARARAVLAEAEGRAGTRRSWSARTPVVQVPVPPDAAVPSSGARDGHRPDSHALPVDPRLAGLLPSLDRGTTLTVAGSTSLLLALLAEASAAGSWVALVGMPGVGVLAASQLGLALDRVVLVPDPGPEGSRVLAALLDGMDAVVVGAVALSDADRRRLSARARERSAVLLTTTPWPGASVVLTASVSRWGGVGRGEGRLRDGVLTVDRQGRGAAGRGWRGEVVLPGTGSGRGPGARTGSAGSAAAHTSRASHGLEQPEGRRAG
ncbi:hypothetical protein [Actinotalea sp.]|uniref:hypothetical protein n=1 Tax=Actinotalea sp. TaxID=1872145 RepID=UPI003563420D